MRDRSRFDQLLPLETAEGARVCLIGCGGIGSYVAPMLARMGVRTFSLVDFDRVEDTNVATQNFSEEDVGLFKAARLTVLLRKIQPDSLIHLYTARFESIHLADANIVIPAVDNIETRREVWDWVKALCPPDTLVIDPRTGAETLDLYAVRLGRGWDDWYTNVLAEDGYADDPCGARAIAYTGALAGSVVASVVRRCLVDPTLQLWLTADLGALAGPALTTVRSTVTPPAASLTVNAA